MLSIQRKLPVAESYNSKAAGLKPITLLQQGSISGVFL